VSVRGSRRSTATLRDQPIAGETSASGPFAVEAATLAVATAARLQVVDITDQVMARVREAGIREGLVSVFSLHTTCTLFINEHQTALVADITRFLEEIVERDAAWLHNDPEHSDCDRMNADSHLRALLVGHSLTLQVSGGEIVLGQWQRLLLAELDGPRDRSLRITVLGVR
jgi:secondary thiamine-phosphate synthase enzyme